MIAPPTLVLLHHFGGSARSWHEVRALLEERHICLAPDLPGFGSAAGAPGPFTVATQADHVAALIAAHQIGDHVLVGHSMGGKIALALAARRAPGLRALVLLAPSPPTPEPIVDSARARQIAGWGDRAIAETTLGDIAARPLSPAVHGRTLDDMLRCGERGWRDWLTGGSREDITSLLASIEVPVSVLSGECDTQIPTDLLRREVIDRLQGSGLTILPGAGHLLPLETPGPVARFIVRVSDPARLATHRVAAASSDFDDSTARSPQSVGIVGGAVSPYIPGIA